MNYPSYFLEYPILSLIIDGFMKRRGSFPKQRNFMVQREQRSPSRWKLRKPTRQCKNKVLRFMLKLFLKGAPWSPATPQSALITSRVTDCSRYGTIGSETLTGLDCQDCVELLLKAAEIPTAE